MLFCDSSFVDLFDVVNSTLFTGTVRTCAIASTNECQAESDVVIPELDLTNLIGLFCYCSTSDMCNGNKTDTLYPNVTNVQNTTSFPDSAAENATTELPAIRDSAHQISVGRMALSFTVTSLLALAAAEFFIH